MGSEGEMTGTWCVEQAASDMGSLRVLPVE